MINFISRVLCRFGFHKYPICGDMNGKWLCQRCCKILGYGPHCLPRPWPPPPPRVIYVFVVLSLLSCDVNAQIAAAGWCVVTDSKDSRSEQPPEQPDDSFPPQEDEKSTSLGCDIGIGFLFYQYKHLGLVGVIGSKSLGPGIAWIINPDARSETDHRPVMAIAVGITTPYDEDGIYKDIQLTLGMTLSLRQGVEE